MKTRSACLLLLLVALSVHKSEASIFSDVLSWVGLGGNKVTEESIADDDIKTVEDEANIVDSTVIEDNVVLMEAETDDVDINIDTDEKVTNARTEEL